MTMTTETRYALEIVSDTICPWCYIGKARIDAALNLIDDEIPFDIVWRPFELNPDMPREGVDRRTYRTAKFGSWEKSLSLDEQVAAAAAESDLEIHHDRMAVTPNTLSSHVLIRLAGDRGAQDAVVGALFEAYFLHGRDIGDLQVLGDIGQANGLDRDEVDAAIRNDVHRADIKAEAQAFAQAGVNGVPTVLLNRFALFSGARPPELIADILRKAAAHEQIIAAGRQAMPVD